MPDLPPPRDREELRELLARELCLTLGSACPVPTFSGHYKHVDQLLNALTAAGIALVPVEPTRDMYLAPNHTGATIDRDEGQFGITGYEAQDVYAAMLAASPYRSPS